MTERLVFLCGTLEPGKDGVGDYARTLAAELTEAGCQVRLVAAYDKYATTLRETSQQQVETAVSTLRIPYATPMHERMQALQGVVDDFKPDWISLQYVPYAYNLKGLPLAFALALGRLRYTGRWHFMFHELWIDHRGLRSPKDSLISGLQRLAVTLLNRSLRPVVRHTHVPEYQQKLSDLGISTLPLPLFANVAPAPNQSRNSAPEKMERMTFRLGFFSQMKMKPGVLEFIAELETWLAEQRRPLEIRLIGGAPQRVQSAAATLRDRFPATKVSTTGFLPIEAISNELAALDLGLSPVQYHTIGKSGTVAAFLSHRVPVAAPWVTFDRPSFFTPELMAGVINKFTVQALESANRAVRDLDVRVISVAGVAARFSTDLGLAVPQATSKSK